jgi:hypothetical protein
MPMGRESQTSIWLSGWGNSEVQQIVDLNAEKVQNGPHGLYENFAE